MATTYFDLHFHPLFKNYISAYEDKFPTQRNSGELVKAFKLSSKIANRVDDMVLHILQSQCCVDQCTENDQHTLGVAAIANLEFGFADSRGFLSDVLKSDFTSPMDKKYFDKVKNGEVSYYRLLHRELDLYRKLKEDGKLQFLSRKNPADIFEEKDSGIKVTLKGMHLVVGLEGGHNLYRMKIAQTLKADDDTTGIDPNDHFGKEFIKGSQMGINPVQSLNNLHQLLWKNDMDILYLTLTHLSHISEQFLATHAFGMKMLRHAAFYPSGNGISALGRDVIRACSNMQQDGKACPLLIDIKHMGLKSRMDYYQMRKTESIKMPVIASHVGVTGYSIKEWKDALKRDKCKIYNYEGVRTVEIQMERRRCGEWGSAINNEFTFNPWSINLMDDDIIEILNSKGLIGMSLDVRILGFQAKIGLNTGDQSEYISTADFQTHFPYIGLLTLPGDKLEAMAEAAESWLIPTKEERHPLCLCFNIIHIISVGQLRTDLPDEAIWRSICIGSDFDGLIEPVKVCQDAGSVQELEYNLLKWLPVAAKAYEKENGGGMLQSFPQGDALKKAVRGIIYENGARFLQTWLRNA